MVIAYVPTSFWATVLARTGSALPYAITSKAQKKEEERSFITVKPSHAAFASHAALIVSMEEPAAGPLAMWLHQSRVAGYQAKWANSSTHSGRAFDSLPLVSDTAELDNVLRKTSRRLP